VKKQNPSTEVGGPHGSAGGANTKASNPKDLIGVRKVPIFSVLSMRVLARVALALLEGALKYGRHNYRCIGVAASVYVDATARHMALFWEGEDIDQESRAGLHHIDKAIAGLMVLRDSILMGNWVDDRPIKQADGDWVTKGNATASTLVDAFPNPVQPYTELGRQEQPSPKQVVDTLRTWDNTAAERKA